MFKGQGGLNTASLDAGGLEHARNELLDKRVFTEFADSTVLKHKKRSYLFFKLLLVNQ